ncbi:AAA-like domain-containing protein [Acaryochloris sp. CCMEE 5410]|uniref:WD40 domain-containing protein n=1 Tax=Acaryochloris sp. CCMEE 5410 TaxID=310037 RepID=UPI00024841E8|nr:AAA-like domain-containing protein [Acaryochloris sp. CCMEE 5410]KAI9130943.1 AAA-like domain-containing protein [Acaryochloris sp. CCMEE 5410]
MQYQIGGSLSASASTYIARQADQQIYAALKRGEFCYVLNSRQMGKSSLLVQTRHRLQAEGYRCAVVDMTNIGSENITPLQWYKGMIKDLWRNFKLIRQFDFKSWWQDEADISLLQRLSQFIKVGLLEQFPDQQLVIFIDEIDSILGLPFSVDDFFALIRFCYNQRAVDPDYCRLNFALFGVATPSDLIQNRQRTPFNLGTAIPLQGFTVAESKILAQGLDLKGGDADAILAAILYWTQGQPFLTQKLCQLVAQASDEAVSISPGKEANWVEQVVKDHILQHWESQDEPEHLRTVQNRLLNHSASAGRRLGLYQQVLQATAIPAEESPDQTDLILSGLVVKQDGQLRVKNPIYRQVFNQAWVEKQLGRLRPYKTSLEFWLASEQQDESRLLRGQTLQEALDWSQGKRLSDEDHQFLTASVECDRKQIQMTLEAERARAIETQLQQEQQTTKLQKRFSITVSIAFLIAVGLGGAAYQQAQTAQKQTELAQASEQKTLESNIRAFLSSSQGNMDSHRQLEALADIIQAHQQLDHLQKGADGLANEIQATLLSNVHRMVERNRLTLGVKVEHVAISPDGTQIATAAADGSVSLWGWDGQIRWQKFNHQAEVNQVVFSPDGQTLASASADRTVKLWNLQGKVIHTLSSFDAEVRALVFNAKGDRIVTSTNSHKVQSWTLKGELINSITKTKFFTQSADGRYLANNYKGHVIQIRDADSTLIRELPPAPELLRIIRLSPNGDYIAATGLDQKIRIRTKKGKVVSELPGHGALIRDMAFSPNGELIASVSSDKTVKLWHRNGQLLRTFKGHQATVWSVTFSPDGQFLLSSSEDGTVRYWQLNNPFWQRLVGPTDFLSQVAYHSDGQQLAAIAPSHKIYRWHRQTSTTFEAVPQVTSPELGGPLHGLAYHPNKPEFVTTDRGGYIHIWNADGSLRTRRSTPSRLWSVEYSPDGHQLAIGSADNTIQRWQFDDQGQLEQTPFQILDGHQATVRDVSFSPDGQWFVSASLDKTLKLWAKDGTLKTTLSEHRAAVQSVAISPNSQWFVSASEDSDIKLWTASGQLIQTLPDHQSAVREVAISPDGKWLASAAMDNTVKLWQVDLSRTKPATLVRTLTGHDRAVRSVAFSPDGKSLVSASDDQTLMRWNLAKLLQIKEEEYACRWISNFLKNNAQGHQHRHLCSPL